MMTNKDTNKKGTEFVQPDKELLRKNIMETLARIAKFREKKFEDSTLIREELGVDSIMSIEIIANIEKQYNISIEEKKMLDIKTVGEFVDYIYNLTNKK